jgi:predicted ArsR family transcriptional regulator
MDEAFMTRTKLDERFFESTRGKIVLRLRNSQQTVNDLAEFLNVSDNAVRAHLAGLERDGIVAQSGVVRGHRKPHFVYALTDEANRLFPRSYDSLLNRVLDQLKMRLSPAAIREILHDVGRSFGFGTDKKRSEKERLDDAVEALAELGGAAVIEQTDGHTFIRSEACPFGETVKEHPDVCHVAESMLTDIIGKTVKEKCDRTGAPKCRFEVSG